MTGRERVERVLRGEAVDRPPVMPILHTGLAPLFGVPLGAFFTRAETMAGVTVRGCRELGLDGVQLSMGVTGEAEALGARTDQPENGAPILREHLLADPERLPALRRINPAAGGRMPLFFDAVRQVVTEVGDRVFVLATLRGPLLAAAQLRGIEPILVEMLEHPESVERILDFTSEMALVLGKWLLQSGAHGLVIGEATCSPNFISPALYRRLVLPRHQALIRHLRDAGWPAVGLHICGDTTPILEDILSTGVTFLDVDYQVPAGRAIALVRGRAALRGNLDPSSLFRFGTPEAVGAATRELRRAVAGTRWILSSGCDIPPGTPVENLRAFVDQARSE